MIENCDEVGLFEDILNPFEQTFRRAVEKKTDTHPITIAETIANTPVAPVDDTLHTPHVFPIYTNKNQNRQENNTNKQDSGSKHEDLNRSITPIKTLDSPKEREPLKLILKATKSAEILKTKYEPENLSCSISADAIPKVSPIEIPKPIVPKHVLSQPIKILPKIENVPIPTLSIHTTSVVMPITHQQIIGTDTDVKQKLKAVILKNNNQPTPVLTTIPQAQLLIVPHEVPMTTKLQSNSPRQQNQQSQRKKLPPKASIKTDSDDKCSPPKLAKRVTNEGNREAAKRYRNRLKQKHEAILNRNEFLVDENRQLRVEVKRLKELLAQHKNCNVTLSQSINIDGIISPPMGKIACPCDVPCNIKCEESMSLS